MIGTHSVKAIDATVRQDGIYADIVKPHSDYLISSQTVKMRRKFFSMPRNAANLNKFIDEARTLHPWIPATPPAMPDVTSARVSHWTFR